MRKGQALNKAYAKMISQHFLGQDGLIYWMVDLNDNWRACNCLG